jgi:hypothetical protein
MAVEGKVVIVHGSKAEILAMARFFTDVARHLESSAYCHMHLRDSMPGWSKTEHIDCEVTVDERTA